MHIATYTYEIKVLEYLASINRFPEVRIWKDPQTKQFLVECSPSFEICMGTGESLSLALQDLVKQLEDYLEKDEYNYLEDLRDEL